MEEANRFHGKFSEEGFLCGFAPSAGASLFFIADKELQAATVKKTGEDGRAGLAALLGLIVDSNATTCEKILKCGVLPAEVTQEGALGDEKAAKRRVSTQELKAVFWSAVERGRGLDLIGKAACILVSDVFGCILQKSIDDLNSGCEGKVGFSGEDTVDVENRRKNDKEE